MANSRTIRKTGQPARLLTRRAFVGAALAGFGAIAAFGLTACETPGRQYYEDLHHGDGWLEGFSVDSEISEEPVTLVIYADEILENYGEPRAPRMQDIVERYHGNYGRADVTIDWRWTSPDKLADYAENGMPEDADGCIAQIELVMAAAEVGYLYDGIAHTSRRDINWFSVSTTMFRLKGSKAKMPKANTADGADFVDIDEGGSGIYETRMMQLAKLKGRLAIAAEGTRQGTAARMCLYQAGLYTEESGQGGRIDKSVRDKIAVYDDVEDVFAAVKSGECSLGIAFVVDVNWHEGFECTYVPDNRYGFAMSSASVVGSEKAAQVRDFLQYVRIVE
mgnify:CR=1 FL=1